MPAGILLNFMPPERLVDWVRRAEDAGFDEIWHEGGFIHATAVAMASNRTPIGTGILTALNHEPLIVAGYAAALASLSNERFRLGIGAAVNADRLSEFQRDLSHAAPRMAEYMQLLRRYWRGEAGTFEGTYFHLDIATPPAGVQIPIYLGALTPTMIKMAGRAADGVCGHPFWPAPYAKDVILPALDAGRRQAGRAGAVPISGWIFTAIGADRDEARNDVRRYYTRAIARTGLPHIASRMGWEAPFTVVRAQVEAGNEAGALAALTDDMIDQLAITGSPDQARREYAARWDGLYDVPVFFSPGGPRTTDYLQAIIDTFGRH